jgi:hypothetical protein
LKLKQFLVAVFIGLVAFAGTTRWQSLNEPLIMTDGQGYYAYLPATFIYQDLQFNFVDSIEQAYYPETKRAKYVVPTGSGNVNKYFVGTAVVQTPFFVSACVVSWAFGAPVDGYSWPFQLMIGIAAIAALMFGMLFLGKLLLALGFSKNTSVFSLLFIVFGTNLFYYSVYEPSMSHVYSFFTVSMFLFYSRAALLEYGTKAIVLASIAFGLTVLIRPVNGLVLLALPVVVGGTPEFLVGLEGNLNRPKRLLTAIAPGVLIMAIQPLVYWIQTGSPLVWSYQEEGFNFLSPEIVNVLFSYRKGLFVYCPILLLAVAGAFLAMNKRKGGAVELLLVLGIATWVISSWWMWYYGGSYGQRAFIEFYPLFAIGLSIALDKGLGRIGSGWIKTIGLTLVVLQLVQTYQYVNHIIPFDNMTKTKYWNLFLRTGGDLAWYYSGYKGEDTYSGVDSLLVKNDMETEKGWGNEQQLTNTEANSGKQSALLASNENYGLTFRKEVGSSQPELIRVSAWVRSSSCFSNVSFVCALEDTDGNNYFWANRPLRPQFAGRNEWSWVTALFRCGTPKDSTDQLVVYPMKSDHSTIYMDDLEISLISTN